MRAKVASAPNICGDTRAKRNVATHNFEGPFKDLTATEAKTKRSQRGRRKGSDGAKAQHDEDNSTCGEAMADVHEKELKNHAKSKCEEACVVQGSPAELKSHMVSKADAHEDHAKSKCEEVAELSEATKAKESQGTELPQADEAKKFSEALKAKGSQIAEPQKVQESKKATFDRMLQDHAKSKCEEDAELSEDTKAKESQGTELLQADEAKKFSEALKAKGSQIAESQEVKEDESKKAWIKARFDRVHAELQAQAEKELAEEPAQFLRAWG